MNFGMGDAPPAAAESAAAVYAALHTHSLSCIALRLADEIPMRDSCSTAAFQ